MSSVYLNTKPAQCIPRERINIALAGGREHYSAGQWHHLPGRPAACEGCHGENITAEELGGAALHCETSGLILP